MGLEISIDRENCMGSGNCTFTAPGVFGLDDDGIAVVLDPTAQPDEKSVARGAGLSDPGDRDHARRRTDRLTVTFRRVAAAARRTGYRRPR